MTPKLVLSLFPGIGLLDRAFELEGFTVVRGPDLLFGGDVRSFNAPDGVFDGVIGGPPCQDFSAARRTPATGHGREMLDEFCRIVGEAAPRWFVCENVPAVPDIRVPRFRVQRIDVDNGWFAMTRRPRAIQFGRHRSATAVSHRAAGDFTDTVASQTVAGPDTVRPLDIPRGKVHPDAEPTVCGASDPRTFRTLCRMQGLDDSFELPGFTEHGRKQAVGNGVPLPLGRVIARAVLDAAYAEPGTGVAETPAVRQPRCSECERPITGRRVTCGDRCRKRREIRRKREGARGEL